MSDHLSEIQTQSSYPIQLDIEYPDRKMNRWTTFFRLILAIPILFLFYVVALSFIQLPQEKPIALNNFLIFAPLIMILLFKKYPKWWFDWNVELYRFALRVSTYVLLLTDQYPSTDQHQTVTFNVVYPQPSDLNRFMPLVKWILAIPHAIILIILGIFSILVSIVAWFAILFTGRYPKSIFDFVVGVFRWNARVFGYCILLFTDKYPPFSLK